MRATETTFANQVALKSSSGFKKVNYKCPIIGMSNDIAKEGLIQKATQKGIARVIRKPITLQDIMLICKDFYFRVQ